MSEDKSAAFHSHVFPQSAYRKFDAPNSEGPSKRQPIDIVLEDLKIKNPTLKKELREKIEQADNLVLQKLLPESLLQKAKADGHREKIYDKLGLSS